MHGDKDGLQVRSDELIDWPEFAPKLVELNVASKNNTVVTLEVCQAAFMATLLKPVDRCPIWGLVGSRDSVYDPPEAFITFYEELISNGDLNVALAKLNEEYSQRTHDPARYEVIAAQDLLNSHIAKWRVNNEEKEKIKARARLARKWRQERLGGGFSRPETHSQMEERIQRVIQNALLKLRNNYLMLDLYPDQAKRFS
jgi:hypothetical protein